VGRSVTPRLLSMFGAQAPFKAARPDAADGSPLPCARGDPVSGSPLHYCGEAQFGRDLRRPFVITVFRACRLAGRRATTERLVCAAAESGSFVVPLADLHSAARICPPEVLTARTLSRLGVSRPEDDAGRSAAEAVDSDRLGHPI
jgi:hypothetical protein